MVVSIATQTNILADSVLLSVPPHGSRAFFLLSEVIYMAILRKENKERYTTIPMEIIRDERLSLKDIGLLVSMLSLPDNWEFSENGLEQIYKNDGQTSIRTGLKNLEKNGYLKRIRTRSPNGKIASVDWYLYEKPQLEKPHCENQSVENHPEYNTNKSNTKQSNTKDIKKERKSNSFDTIIENYSNDTKTIELLKEWLKVRKAKRAALTDRAIQMNIDKLDKLAAESNMTVCEYLSEVICRGWAAFYPITNYKRDPKTIKNNTVNKKSEYDDFMAELQEMYEG